MNLAFLLNVVGVIGVGLILSSYALLQIGKLESRSVAYLMMNFLGSSLILASLIVDWNLSAALVEFAWATISLVALLRMIYTRYKT